jgi:diguanylate cyclase (GGDEF)-like protein/PAS domain S-box-containing protein
VSSLRVAVVEPGSRPLTVLVLTPMIGGHYFGALLTGISREIVGAGGRLVLVQTLDGGLRRDEECEVSAFDLPVAWAQVDGVVSITSAVGGAYLQRLRAAGKPVVLASARPPGFDAPLAVPDNYAGTRAAIEHLIAHGHTRIGFVGNLAQFDVCERYAAYRQILQEHGLTVDPNFFFVAPNNDFSGGTRAAADVLSAAERPSAVMVATDRNAIGLMQVLSDAGVAIPGDLAVVGYDNLEEATFSSPPLTSINQRFDEVGAFAGRLVLAQMRSEAASFTPKAPPAAKLVLRGSCGCATDGLGRGAASGGRSPGVTPAGLRGELKEQLAVRLLTGHALIDEPMREALTVTVAAAAQLVERSTTISAADVHDLTTSLHRLTSHPDVLRRLASEVLDYFRRAAGTMAEPAGAAAAGLSQVSTALWQLQAGAFLQQADNTHAALEEQYVVETRMLDVAHSGASSLDWLAATGVRAGALALWQDGPSSGRLRIASVYDPDELLADQLDTVVSPEHFPPQRLIDAAETVDEGGVCIVVPVCSKNRDWGLLAIIGEINTASALETYRHWATQLCASFEEQELHQAVQASEGRYALAARATNDGLWEWDLRTNEFYMSEQCRRMVAIDAEVTRGHLDRWMALVHPDDVMELRRATDTVIRGAVDTVTSEYRLRSRQGSYRWVLSRALSVRAADGTVERLVGSLADVHERRALEDQLRQNALYDALTGLPNRRLFLDRLDHAVSLWHRSKTPFAVIFLDLDGFKAINDSLGHQMGDRVLNEVGARIKHELRDVDTGARFGGDEFAILLHDTGDDAVLRIAHRVQGGLANVIGLDGHEFTIGASLGIATSANGYVSAEDVLRDADIAMYRAKETERGTVSFFDAAMHAHAMHELHLNADLRRALDQDQFEMHYQPIVNLATGRTDRFEALVRWRHPERGLVMPDEFLPAMIETGAIVQLSHWIIDEVCRQLGAWGPAVANVAMNVSDREFWHSDLLTHVLQALHRHNLTADRLTLEITEGVIMRRPEVALRLMRDMHEAGLQLHIDDFGTGYSSLDTLHRFPVDAFKIDRSFVAGLTTSDRTEELVRAIIAMGKALGLDVVAEGVETTEQLQFLQDIGCATGQGFLFMPAVTGDRALELIGRVLVSEQPPRLTLTQPPPVPDPDRRLRAG